MGDAIDWNYVLGPLLSAGAGWSQPEIAALELATFSYPRRAVRTRPDLDHLPFATRPVPWYRRGRFLVDGDAAQASIRPGNFLEHLAGDYYIQDAGSMLALAICDVRPGQWVCDTCAAPGGKASGMAESLGGQGLLLANEVIASRLGVLDLALSRTGRSNHLITSLEVDELRRLCGAVFDIVLVDAPCTGQTLVGRGKQSLSAFSPAQIEHSRARQTRIVQHAAGLVRPGGKLVYSTCSYSYAENEQVVENFLLAAPDWQIEPLSELAAWQSPLLAGSYRVWPQRDGCAGAFAAAVRRNASPAEPHCEKTRARRSGRWQPLREFPTTLSALKVHASSGWWQQKHVVHWIDPAFPEPWIDACWGGVPIAFEKGKRWEPAYAAALNQSGICRAASSIELCDADAIKYAAGETLRAGSTTNNSWMLARWRSRPLSWTKAAGGILKNHLPKPVRQTHLVCGNPSGEPC